MGIEQECRHILHLLFVQDAVVAKTRHVGAGHEGVGIINLAISIALSLRVIPRALPKALWMRLLELAIWYFMVGGLGLALEQHQGQIYPQGWEFYATTAALFVTLAFPGFVFRYLFKRRG